MNTKLRRFIARPLNSTTSLKVMLEAPLADALRNVQQTHPALVLHDRHASFSLITRRALSMYIERLNALPASAVETEQQAVLQLS